MFLFGGLRPWQPLPGGALKLVVAGLIFATGTAQTKDGVPAVGRVAVTQLPPEAQRVLTRVHTGGPFVSPKDGTVFANRERILAPRSRGYYREYTVPTPGARDRGARRIICGGSESKAPDACFFTADHYASFRRIVP